LNKSGDVVVGEFGGYGEESELRRRVKAFVEGGDVG